MKLEFSLGITPEGGEGDDVGSFQFARDTNDEDGDYCYVQMEDFEMPCSVTAALDREDVEALRDFLTHVLEYTL